MEHCWKGLNNWYLAVIVRYLLGSQRLKICRLFWRKCPKPCHSLWRCSHFIRRIIYDPFLVFWGQIPKTRQCQHRLKLLTFGFGHKSEWTRLWNSSSLQVPISEFKVDPFFHRFRWVLGWWRHCRRKHRKMLRGCRWSRQYGRQLQ